MNEVPRLPDREPASMVQCPRCRGTGRIGPADAVCVVCWCRGRIEYWRWQQLMDDDRRRSSHARYPGRAARRRDAAAAPQDAEPAPEEPADAGFPAPACLKCAPTERCAQCPFGPFVLAA